jgi:alpha-1,2-mannosyltransferase
VNFSRISPDKRNHKFIEAVSRIPEERREGWKFRVIGKLRESERSYFEKLKSMRQDLGLENCLEIRTDLDFDELKTELKTSRLYIHTAINETMGITPVEALAAGNDILVHKSGGPWVDIADQGEYGEGWSDEEELEKKMKDFMKNGEPEVERNVKRARKFDRDRFRESFSELISEVER